MGHLSPELIIPPHCLHLIDWFWDLSSARSNGVNGANPLSFTDIANWAALTGNLVNRDEVAVIRAMDGAFLAATGQEQAEQLERSKAQQNGGPGNTRPQGRQR